MLEARSLLNINRSATASIVRYRFAWRTFTQFSSEDFALTWPEPSECLPDVGEEAPPLEGLQVERMQEFVGDRAEALYDLVLVCWCIPIQVVADSTAA